MRVLRHVDIGNSMDPLQALRQTVQAQQPITYLTDESTPSETLQVATHIGLGPNDLRFPKTAATRYQRPSATRRDWVAHPEDFFTLQAIILAYVSKDLSTAEYLKRARDTFAGATAFVSVTDRAPLVEWLEGKSQTLERLVPLQGPSLLCSISWVF